MSGDLTSAARGLGFTGTLPKGATDIQKDGNGHYKVTVGNEVKIFNADGTPANDNSLASAAQDNSRSSSGSNSGSRTESQPQSQPQLQSQSQSQPQLQSQSQSQQSSQNRPQGSGMGESVFNGSFSGGFTIDPAAMGNAAMNTDAILQFGSEIPFGLGGQFSQAALAQNIMDYVGAASFNFDFSNYMAASSPQSDQSVSQNPSVAGGDTQVTDSDGNTKTVAQLAEDGGYKKTATDGVYQKNGKYYKYNVDKKEFEKVAEAEAKKAKEADDKKAADTAKEASDKKIDAEAASIAEDLYDAMKGAGTKNDKLQQTIERINKDNVMAVMKAWDENFADGMDGETLLESIQGEHHTGWFGNAQEKQEKLILDALVGRAEELGLINEAHAARAKVNSEHSAWFTSDDTVRAAIENLYAKIKAKEAEQAGS